MARYRVLINKTWPNGNADADIAHVYDKEQAHRLIANELDRLYPGQWERANGEQYAEKGAAVGAVVMGLVIEDLSPYEFRQRQIDSWAQRVRTLEHDLDSARKNLAHWEELQRTKQADED